MGDEPMNGCSQRGPSVGDCLELAKDATGHMVGLHHRRGGIDLGCHVVFLSPTAVEVEQVPSEWREMYELPQGPVLGRLSSDGRLTLPNNVEIAVLPESLRVYVVNAGAIQEAR
jgi:hypothetical protein